jgi:uncharacterized membrane protein
MLAQSRRARAWADALDRSIDALRPVEFEGGRPRSEAAPGPGRVSSLRTAAYIAIGIILVGVGLVLLLNAGGQR